MKRLRGSSAWASARGLPALAGVLVLASALSCRGGGGEGGKARGAGSSAERVERPSASARGSAPAPACKAPAALEAGSDAAAWFPVSVAGHCLDPHADVRRYGGKANPPLAAACAALGVDCELPLRLGLARVVSVRYLDQAGALGQITASVWSFDDPESALAYLTARVAVSEELGRRPALIDAGAGGTLEGTSAALVRAGSVALLQLEDERSAPADRAGRAARVLPELARVVGARLPGSLRPPRAVELLPVEGRALSGLRYEGFDLFGVAGVGRGARTHYTGAAGTEDVVALVRSDEDAADDVMVTLRKVDGARKIKQAPYGAIRLRQLEGTKEPMDWVLGRKGKVILGVGAPVVVVPKKKGVPKPPDKSLLRLKSLLDRVAGS